MQSYETGISKQSDYYIYTASPQTKAMFFYPLCTGHFYYSAGYSLHRKSYDSFLLMYVKKGECKVVVDDISYTATENQIVFLDCYKPHHYYTDKGWEALWLHFDGPVARQYFELITEGSNLVLSLRDDYLFRKYIDKVYMAFRENAALKEALLSQAITNMLTQLITAKDLPARSLAGSDVIEDITAYINEHICEALTLELLAEKAALSPYYFTRLFKKETGYTPHEYILATRINHAKFLLKNTNISIKEICFLSGFGNESSFCATFKKWEQTTPKNYRLAMKV
ncbi:AraC family transcriptional regulator [Konateibacter massiliensis]|uniref:AraC family transcriptional regulator n=1 Tax=Konateibacter massiliensis TaxID=2002841 RepID=UPI000C15CBB2|nr:AraC family transcriptional regulator [Konateibacter massiliensis]